MLKTVLGFVGRIALDIAFKSHELTDEEKLQEIKGFFEREGVIKPEDGKWLIQQAEKVEELQREIEGLKERIDEIEM